MVAFLVCATTLKIGGSCKPNYFLWRGAGVKFFFFHFNPHVALHQTTHRFCLDLFSSWRKAHFTGSIGNRGGHSDITHPFFIQIQWKFFSNDRTRYQIEWASFGNVSSEKIFKRFSRSPFFQSMLVVSYAIVDDILRTNWKVLMNSF